MIKHLQFILKTGLTILLLVLSIASAYSQERKITGTVKDAESGETLIGVNIVMTQDKSRGSVSDIDGNFEITVPATADSLNFSYVGYTSQTVAITSSVINISLIPGKQLAEVVVVGYGTQKTKEVTSAVASVKSEDFNSGNVSDPIQLIQGKVAGLSIVKPGGDPNADFTIRLRGLSTFGSNTEPLIIIDGVQGASLKSVDPQDIASMDVLKDASAAAIYGTRAASGVILITTKKGKATEGRKGANVEFNTNFTVESIAKKMDVLTRDEYLQFSNATDYGSETDWMDEITQKGFSQVYNLAVNGATEKSNYRVSFNYRKGNGVVVGTGYDQYNGRLNFTQKALNDMVTFDFNLSATLRDEEYAPGEALGFVTNYNPTAPVYGTGSDTSAATRAYVNEWGGYFQQPAFSFYNPLAVVEQNTQDGTKKEVVGSLRTTFKPVKWGQLAIFYSQERGNDLYGTYTSKYSLFNATRTDKSGNHSGFARKNTEDRFHQLLEITGELQKDFGDFNVKVLGGYSYQDEITDRYSAYGEGFLTDAFSYNSLGSAAGIVANNEMVSSYKFGSTLIGFFARATVNWKDGVFLTGNFRRDGSTMFGENNQWGSFPGVSAGVDITRFIEIPYVNRLKIRGGYGETGNLPPNPYLSKDLFNVDPNGNFFYQGDFIQAYKLVRNANPDLKWEVKKELGFGIDFFLLNYRLTGSIDYYNSKSTDLMLEYTVPVPPYPTDKMWLNVGELENSGIEFAMNYDVFQKTKVKWSTNLNFAYYLDAKLNKITSDIATGGSERFYGTLGDPYLTGVQTILVNEGGAIGQIIAPVFIEIAYDSVANKYYKKYKDVDGDGEFNSKKDYEIVGNGLPDFQIGWGNNLSFKNFYLNFFLRGVFGHSLVNVNNARYGEPSTIAIQSGMGIALDYIQAQDGIQYSDVHVEKASYVKLDNFAFGYNFKIPENKYISLLKVYFSGQNLFTISDYSGVDPEVRYGDANDNNNPLAPGIDREKTYFSTRSFTLGINVIF
jgi:iron complex outermembrane receptor protein